MLSINSQPTLASSSASLDTGPRQGGVNQELKGAVMALAKMLTELAAMLKQTADAGASEGSPGGGSPAPNTGFGGAAGQSMFPSGLHNGTLAPAAQRGAPAAAAKNEKDFSAKPSATDKRPPGDNRSARQIIDDNPVLKNLGHQKDIDPEALKKQVGDFEHDPDAAYRAAHVLNYIDNSNTAQGTKRKNAGDGDIQGLTKNGDARHGTEAGMLKDFNEKGYDSLPAAGANNLARTKDSHVRPDGSTKNDFQAGLSKAGDKLFFVPGLSNVLKGAGNAKDGDVGDMLKGAAGGVTKTWKNTAEGAVESAKSGDITPRGMLAGAYTKNIENNEQSPEWAKKAASLM